MASVFVIYVAFFFLFLKKPFNYTYGVVKINNDKQLFWANPKLRASWVQTENVTVFTWMAKGFGLVCLGWLNG